MERKQKASTESFVLLAVVAGIFVALNVLSYSGLSKRYDTTQNQRYTLSKGSGNLLKRMK